MIGEDVRKVTIHFEKLMEKRIMEFQTNIFEGVEPPSSSKYNLIGTKLPTSQEWQSDHRFSKPILSS